MRYFIYLLLLLLVCCCPKSKEKLDSDQYIRTELYFGLPKPEDSVAATWEVFTDSFITPIFPSGYTILDADGRWRDKDSISTAKEKSKIVIVIYKPDSTKENGIQYIIQHYKQQFKQKAILRVDNRVTTNLDNY